MTGPLDGDERARIASFLEDYGDSEEALCPTCLAEYRADITTCPECEGAVLPAARAPQMVRARLQAASGFGLAIEGAVSCSCGADDDDDDHDEHDDDDADVDDREPAPLDEAERERLRSFLGTLSDERPEVVCLDCLALHRRGTPACPSCNNGLLSVEEAVIALQHLIETDDGAAPVALAFVPGDDDDTDVDPVAAVVAGDRAHTERAEAIARYLQRYGDLDVDADVCMDCLEEFRIGLGQCPQCGASLTPSDEARTKLAAEARRR